MAQINNPPPQFTCPKCGNRMKGGGIEIGERLKCPKCGTRLVASHGVEAGGAESPRIDEQGGPRVLYVESERPPAPVASDPDDEPLEYAVRVEPWQRPGAVVDPPARGDQPARLGNAAEEGEQTANALPERSRAAAMSAKRDSRVREKRPGDEEESRDAHDAPEEGAMVWQPGRGVSLWRLFFVGTFSFPFRISVLIYLLFLAGIIIPSAVAVAMAVSSGFAFFFGIAIVLGCLWFVAGSCYGVAILRDTSSGADSVELPDPLALMDSLGDVVYVFTNLFFSSLAGWGIAMLGGSSPGERLLLTASSVLLFFPVFLLSALETNSPALPFSLPVWRSVARAPRAWLLFYVLTFIVLGSEWPLEAVAAHYGGPWISLLAGAVLANAAWMIYFRLLGRLAWYCANKPLCERVE